MKSLLAFTKKEITEQLRSGRLAVIGVLFVIFGIMNPAVAKLTPWLLRMMADSLAESGMIVTDVTVSAMDSWVQFFKNMPIALIAFVLLQAGIFTREYSSGSLILSLTKGLHRSSVVVAKSGVLLLLWTVAFWICFAITYGYNAYFWDNSVAQNLLLSASCWWLFGVFVLSLAVLFSTLARSGTGVLCGVGGVVVFCYLLGLIPKLARFLPTYLTDGNSLIYGSIEAEKYIAAILITSVASLACLCASIPAFNKKQL